MTNLRDAEMRSTLMSERIRQRTDHALRDLVADFDEELTFDPLDGLMIVGSWRTGIEISSPVSAPTATAQMAIAIMLMRLRRLVRSTLGASMTEKRASNRGFLCFPQVTS